MSKVKVINAEQISLLQIKVYYDQNVKSDAQYYDVDNYTIDGLVISSVETVFSSVVNYSILNVTKPLVINTRYTVVVDSDKIQNILNESINISNNFYSFQSWTLKPYVTNINVVSESQINVTFDREMSSSALNISNYEIYSQEYGQSILVSGVSHLGSNVYRLDLNLNYSYMTNSDDHVLKIKNVYDASNNKVDELRIYEFVGVATTLAKLTNISFDTSETPNRIFLTFDRELNKSSALNAYAYNITSPTGYQAYVSKVLISSDCKVVTLHITETTGSSTYTVECLNVLVDLYGNILNPSFKSLTFTGAGHNPSLMYAIMVTENVLELYFDEPMRDDQYTRNAANYIVDNGLTVHSVIAIVENKICLLVKNFAKDIEYTLSITNINFVDNAGNAITLPASVKFFVDSLDGYKDKGIKLYNFLTSGLRAMDSESLLLKRFVDVFQYQFDKQIDLVKQLNSLVTVTTTKDEYLQYFYDKCGWYGLHELFKDFTYDQIRKVIKLSISLWKNRGSSGSYVSMLNSIFGIRSYEVDFFDIRSILDESTKLVHENLGTDFNLLDIEDFYNSFLMIVNNEESINKSVVETLIKTWKPSNESLIIKYYKVFEKFDYYFDALNYKIVEGQDTHTTNTNYLVQNSRLKFSQAAKYETIYSNSVVSQKWSNKFVLYSVFSPRTFAVNDDCFYVMIRHTEGNNDHYYIRFKYNDTLVITRDSDALSVVVNLVDFGLSVENNLYYGIKVEFETHGSSDYIKIFFDGNLVYNGVQTKVKSEGNIGVGKFQKECWISHFELFDLNSNNIVKLE